MLWNRFDSDKSRLNMYENEHYEPGSGISDVGELKREILKIEQDMRGKPKEIIKATAFAFVLDHSAIEVNPACWFGVNVCGLRFGGSPKGIRFQNQNSGGKTEKPLSVLTGKWEKELLAVKPGIVADAMENIWETGAGTFWIDFSHSVPDWDAVLCHGFKGLKDRAAKRRSEMNNLTDKQKVFFESIDMTYAALIRFMYRLADSAQRRIDEDDRMILRRDCFRALAERAPQNIYEAIQLIYLFHLLQQYLETVQARSLGDLDRLLYPFYLKDTQEGTFTKEQIKELFKYWFIQYDFQNHPYNQPLAIGGVSEDGTPIANELSEIVCDAYYEANVANIKIFVCTVKDTPDWLLRKTLDHVRGNRGSYVYMNFDMAVPIMEHSRGITGLKPWQVGTWGCFAMNIKGGDTDCLHFRINVAKSIELVFNNGIDPLTGLRVGVETGPLESMTCYSDFERAFYQQFDELLRRMLVIGEFFDEFAADINPAPMDSATLNYSLEHGEDAFRYGSTSIACSCIGTAADSLAMVRKYVFDLKKISLPELRDAMVKDWKGYEKLRLEIGKDPEKYGNNIDSVDCIFRAIVDHADQYVYKPNKRHGYYSIAISSIDYHIRYGEQTGATPDGRWAKSALSKNIGASIGKDKRGLTALMQSAAKLNAAAFPGSGVLDFLLHPSVCRGEDGLSAMVSLIRAYFAAGGYSLQGNVTDANTLRDAQEHPENYEGLQVRVTGWNWRFNDMTKDYQDEIIQRLEGVD